VLLLPVIFCPRIVVAGCSTLGFHLFLREDGMVSGTIYYIVFCLLFNAFRQSLDAKIQINSK
jgi:hypothetical protein